MKRLLSVLSIIVLLLGVLPIAWAAPAQGKRVLHTKSGPEVGKRVRELQKYNSRVRAALRIFEANATKNGHAPRLDEAVSITQDPAGGSAKLKGALEPPSPFQKVGYRPQEADYSGYGVEMIFIPVYVSATEWQGTAIFNEYDPYGNFLGQYVADVAVVLYSATLGNVIEEVSYQDGQAYLQYGNPDFQFGAPLDSQDPGAIQPLISGRAKPHFEKAGFVPQGIGWEAGSRPVAPPGPPNPRVRQVAKCTAINTVAWGGAGCGVVALMTAGSAYLPCAAGATAASLTGCTLFAIFGN